MVVSPEYLYTPKGYKQLKIDLENVQRSRKEAVATLSRARGLGDLSENGLYKAAKARLAGIDHRIAKLKFLIKMAKVVEREVGESVAFGSVVKIEHEKMQKEIEIVGDYEADPSKSKISYKSPLGAALLSKKRGDSVSVQTPRGKTFYTILSVE